MNLITIPNTDLQCSRLAFGTSSLHHLIDGNSRSKLLSKAIDFGFNYFDSARMYGEGLAEHTLGKFFIGSLRQKVILSTKVGIAANPIFEYSPQLMYAQKSISSVMCRFGMLEKKNKRRDLSLSKVNSNFTKSLKALRTDWVDILFIHETQLSDVNDLILLGNWLMEQKIMGRARYLGLSGNPGACLNISKAIPNLFDIFQVQDSLVDREADILMRAGCELQVTYGYLRTNRLATNPVNVDLIINGALNRNQTGTVLVSTCNVEHLKQLAFLANNRVAN